MHPDTLHDKTPSVTLSEGLRFERPGEGSSTSRQMGGVPTNSSHATRDSVGGNLREKNIEKAFGTLRQVSFTHLDVSRFRDG